MSKSPPEDEPPRSDAHPKPAPDLPPIPEEVRQASLNKDTAKTESSDASGEPVVEVEAITEPVPDAPSAEGYTIIGGDGDEYGPVSIDDVARWIRTGRADGSTLVRAKANAQWQPLRHIPELAALLTGAIPPKPGKVKAIAIMTLVGGVWSVMVALGLGWGVMASMCLACCLIPSTIYSFVAGIFMIVQGILLLGNHPRRHLPRTRWSASLQIGCLLAADLPNVILGILNHVFLGDDAVKAYQRGSNNRTS